MQTAYPAMYPPPPPYLIKPQKKESTVGASIGAIVGSSMVSGIASPIIAGAVLPAMKKNGQLPQDTIDTIQNGAKQALEETGLKDKGVRIRFLDKKPVKRQILENKPFLKSILDSMYIDQVRAGNNAFFNPKDMAFNDNGVRKVYLKKNSIVMPKRDISGAVYHEIGHAMNFHFSKLGKALQHLRPVSMLTPGIIALYGACTKKNDSKTNNFVRDNAGLLAFASTIPMLAEEGMATYKGQKLADKILSKELAARVAKGNKIAYCSYALSALFAGLTAFSAVKIKDSAVKN